MRTLSLFFQRLDDAVLRLVSEELKGYRKVLDSKPINAVKNRMKSAVLSAEVFHRILKFRM